MRRNGLFAVVLGVILLFNGYLYAQEYLNQGIWNTNDGEQKTKDMGKPQQPGGGILLSGDCSDYIDLTGQTLPIIEGGTTVGASNNYGPFSSRPICWIGDWWSASGNAPDVTYKWTVPSDGRYTISLCESNYDCVLLLYNFTCPTEPVYPDDFICGNDDYCGSRSELTGYWFAAGQELLIVVDGYGYNSGSYVLGISAHHADPIDSIIVEAMDEHHFPGMAACVVKDSEIVWTGSYGFADIAGGIEVADTTLFTIASVSKTVTGVALMQLWEQGLFDLDDDINDYLPSELQVHNPYYPSDSITFRMLLTHTSSINDNWTVLDSVVSWGSDSSIPLDTFLVNYLVPGGYYYSTLNYNNQQPGTQWDYSNAAIALVGSLVEALSDTITGISFGQHCQDSIFAPLNMYETSWFLSDIDINNLAIPYDWIGYNYVPYQHYGAAWYPAGTVRTSTLQLARFLLAFIQYGEIDNVRILDSTTVELMTSVQFEVNPSSYFKQGLIWGYANLFGRQAWGHTGGWYGTRTSISFMPAENAGVIAFVNRFVSDEQLAPIIVELREFVAGWPYGSIIGTVSGGSMNPIENALVETAGPGTSDHTDIGGQYFLQYLSAGTYDISFSHEDYADTTIISVVVSAGDTLVLDIQMVPAGCDYVVGDVNGSASYNGLDITYGVNFFKYGSPAPQCPDCPLDDCNSWHYCGDVNASCNYNGLDITYGVNYFKFGSPAPVPCADCPPAE